MSSLSLTLCLGWCLLMRLASRNRASISVRVSMYSTAVTSSV